MYVFLLNVPTCVVCFYSIIVDTTALLCALWHILDATIWRMKHEEKLGDRKKPTENNSNNHELKTCK